MIRSDYTFKDEILKPCKEMIEGVGECIALHVRRTDYVNLNDYHPVCSLDYYAAALEEFPEDMPVLVSLMILNGVAARNISSDSFAFSE